MPADIRLLIDEDTHLALAEALRKRGYDAVHVPEVERLGLEDERSLHRLHREAHWTTAAPDVKDRAEET